jgi:hypothetical protein
VSRGKHYIQRGDGNDNSYKRWKQGEKLSTLGRREYFVVTIRFHFLSRFEHFTCCMYEISYVFYCYLWRWMMWIHVESNLSFDCESHELIENKISE